MLLGAYGLTVRPLRSATRGGRLLVASERKAGQNGQPTRKYTSAKRETSTLVGPPGLEPGTKGL